MAKSDKDLESILQELQSIIDNMSNNDIKIDESIKEYEKAAKLIRDGYAYLDKAKLRVIEIDEKMEALGSIDEL